jgi:hypothetical protein
MLNERENHLTNIILYKKNASLYPFTFCVKLFLWYIIIVYVL